MSELRPRTRQSRKKRILIVTAVSILIAVAMTFTFRAQLRDIADQLSGAEYSGSGKTKIAFVIEPGQDGEDIAKNLVELGITKTLSVTLRKIYAANIVFYPGTYLVPKEINTGRALEILANPENIQVERVTIPEGLRLKGVFKILANKTGLQVTEFEEAAKDLELFEIPSAAPSLEGYLYPATYEFAPDLSADEIMTIMVDRTKDQLISDSVPKNKWHKTLTLASVIQSEARATEDFYKVARVFTNRLAIGMPLQSDATVNYGVGSEDIYTSDAERADPNKYNTYLYAGLPIGPIAGSGALAIDAALNPAEGDWIYFCTVNLKTGETVFSNTYSEHLKAVAQWLKWMKENPGWDD